MIYPDGAPEGEVIAYSTIVVNGKTYRFVGYYENVATDFVMVENSTLATTERWLVGASYATDDFSAYLVQQTEDGWYYLSNADWVGRKEGIVIEGAICGADNAGETVVLTLEGTPELIYYTVTISGKTTYYYGESAPNRFISEALKQTVDGTYEIKLYHDLTTTVSGQAVIGVSGHSVTYKIDLNGYDWTALNSKATKENYAFVFRKASTYIYSSVPGAVWDVTSAYSILCTDGSGYAYFGEPNSTSTAYGKNLTVKCAAINATDMWSNGFYIYGGTFVQEGKTLRNYFLNNIRVKPLAIKNATFILNNAEYFAYGMRMPTVTNCTIISANGAKLFLDLGVDGTKISDVKDPVKDANGTFVNCNFYNIVPNTFEPITITYTDCTFNLSSAIPQAGGYIAYTGGTLASVEALGKTYTFTAKLVSEANVGIVDWGFGLVECWKVGATATHDNVIVDGVFGYTFAPLTVVVGNQTAEKTLAAMKPGVLGMSLTLQSSIGLNLQISEALENITAVTIGGQTFELVEAEDGKYVYTKFVSPDKANGIVIVAITVGSNVHEIPVSVGSYARTILGSAKYEAAHNLTYAMVEYVRVMADDASFLSDVAAPASYAVQTLEAVQSNNNGTILSAIRFNLSGTIAIEITGAEGKDVNLILATTRSEHSTIAGGTAMFAGLYVNEFYGEMTIRVDGEVYKYSLANYLFGVKDNADAAEAVQALYNYTYHADAYVDALLNAEN